MRNFLILGFAPRRVNLANLAGLIGFLFFGEQPTLGVVTGSVIIAVGGMLLAVIKSPSETESTSPA